MAVDGKYIRHKMIELGINSYTELAELSGVDRNTISNVIENKFRPNAATMDKLYKTLKLTPEEGGRVFFGNELT